MQHLVEFKQPHIKKATNRFYMLKTSWINSSNGLFRLRMTCLKTRIYRPEADRSSRHTDIRFYHMLYFGSDPKQVLQGAIAYRTEERTVVQFAERLKIHVNCCPFSLILALSILGKPIEQEIKEIIFFLSYPVITAWVI